MANSIGNGNKTKNTNTALEASERDERSARQAKRLAQHQHWMRVMMEGQATPDLTYQKPKI